MIMEEKEADQAMRCGACVAGSCQIHGAGSKPVSPVTGQPYVHYGTPGATRPWEVAGPPPAAGPLGPPGTVPAVGRRGVPAWAIALIVAGALLMLGCCGIGAASMMAAGTDTAEQPRQEVAEAEEVAPVEVPDPEPGTRSNPFAPGEEFEVEDWRLSLSDTRHGEEVTEEILDENLFNEEPDSGNVFVMVEVDLTYLGEESAQPDMELNIQFLGVDGVAFEGWQHWCGVVPNSLTEVGEMFTDASASAQTCVQVPEDQVEGGIWIVEPLFDFLDSGRVYVRATD